MEEGEKGDTFKQYATIYDEFLEDWENGRKGSNAVQAAIKSFFNEDFISGMNYDLEELGEALAAPFFQGVFSAGGEDYGQNFLNLLYDTYGPEIRGENGKLIASFEEVDGTLSYMFNDMDALAEMLGVQPELLESVTDALGIYSTALDMTDEQLVDSLKKLNNFKDVLSTDIDGAITSVNFDELIKGLAEIGASDEEIAQLVNHFRELGVLEGAPENVEELGAAIEQLKEDGIIDILEQVDQEFNDLDGVVWSVGDGITHIDAGKLAYQLALIKDEDGAYQYTAEQIQNIISRIQEMEGMDIVNLPSSIEEVVQSAQNAQNAITDTKSDAEDLNNTEAEPKIDLDISNAESKRDQVYAILANIGKASATAKVYIQTEEISKNAKGTNDFEGGKTLVNEEGGELIVEGDRAFIANGGNPTILDLEPGTKIYTAEETKNILNGKNLNGAISARARGSGVPLGYYDSTSSSSSSASSSSGSSSSSSSGSYSSSSSSSSYSSNTASSYDSYEDEQESIEDAQEAEIERLEDIVSLRQSELDLMQAQGKPIEDQIAKMKQIQAALHNQAEYMRSIGYSQEEINQLSTEWWNIQEEIKGVQQSLMDELTDALNRELENAEKEKDREIEAIDEEIEKLRNARDLEDEQLDLEEKKLAVLEAQEALVEAQNERTIRMYNASTGQWEWVADASSVQSAEESLKDAQEALKDYEEEQEYEAQIAALEARKEALESAYESLSDELDGIAESMEEPGRSISEILKDIATNGTPQMKATISETNKLLEGLNWYIAAATGQTTGDSITGGSNGNYSGDKVDYAALLLSAGSQEEMEYWAEQRQKKIEAQGLNAALSTKTLAAMWKQGITDVDNIDYAALMMAAETLDEFQYFAALREKKIADLGITNVTSNSELKSEWAKAHGLEANASGIYDSGGILHGVGGIKATTADEMIMPPELTAHMLSPIADDIFRERIAALGWMYGAQDSIPQAFLGRSNTQNHNVTHNDGCYYFNGVQIGAKEANTMTIAQLAQQMQKLSLYKN